MKFDFTVDWQEIDGVTPTVSIDLEGLDEHDRSTKMLEAHKTFYEQDLLRHLGHHGPCGGVYLDVGAYIGNHSVFFAKFLADFVVAVEPSPRAVKVLERNLTANGLTNYAIVNCAAGAAHGSGRLVLPMKFERWAAASHLASSDDTAPHIDIEDGVPIRPIDEIIDELAPQFGNLPITFMKIDVEGMEREVLAGAMGVVQRHRPQLAVELADDDAYTKFTEMLTGLGYRRRGRFCWTPTYHFLVPRLHEFRTGPCDRIKLVKPQ